ncbi:GNAT superfamily N-acetyltransferase [Rhodoblastus acidophilus]|uniref:GNAT family N-acetyltransferase n=1 Tax=Rhodoblastus acidophilus TaxID=1074 RepID=UPI002224B355|nr:GNAT family N-acetyltransferase [Rhodoblastus acidophilus]MCW2316298.1 GNAT superfamily N-acetyltransferase [Rhodoblastus acidophilus]
MNDPKLFSIDLVARESSAASETARALGIEVAAQFGPREEQTFALIARAAAGAVVGGLNGVIHWRWLYVAQFRVAPPARGRGVGGALLDRAERLARETDCVGIYLDTFSPAACAFYERRGFAKAGQIDNFPPGAARVFLAKKL